jgi:hypothetical protein
MRSSAVFISNVTFHKGLGYYALENSYVAKTGLSPCSSVSKTRLPNGRFIK